MAEKESGKALGLAMKTGGEGQSADTIQASAWLSPKVAEKVQAQSPVDMLPMRLQLVRFESATPVPKQAGIPTNLGNGVSERIGAVEKDGERLLVTFIRHAPSLWVNNAGGGQLAPLTQVAHYFLVNRAQDFVDRGSLEGKLTTRIGTVEIAWNTMAYRASKKAGGPRPSLEAINALNDAELIKVTFTEQVRFTHEFKIDPFTVEPANP